MTDFIYSPSATAIADDMRYIPSLMEQQEDIEGQFVQQKGYVGQEFGTEPYDYDLYVKQDKDPTFLLQDDGSKRFVEFSDIVEQRKKQLKEETEQDVVPIWDRAIRRAGELATGDTGAYQRFLSDDVFEKTYERAISSDTYNTILAVADNADQYEEEAERVLTNDEVTNYLAGQADYLDSTAFDVWRRTRGRDEINALAFAAAPAVAIWAGTKGTKAIKKLFARGVPMPEIHKPKNQYKLLKTISDTLKPQLDKLKNVFKTFTKKTITASSRLGTKLIPVTEIAAGALFAQQRLADGDKFGGAMEMLGVALTGGAHGSLATGVGAWLAPFLEAASDVVDGFMFARDMYYAVVDWSGSSLGMGAERIEKNVISGLAGKNTGILRTKLKGDNTGTLFSAMNLAALGFNYLVSGKSATPMGFDKVFERVLDEFGPEQGRRFAHATAITSMLTEIERLKTLDRMSPSYKQERRAILNKVKYITQTLNGLDQRYYGRSMMSGTEVNNTIDYLYQNNFIAGEARQVLKIQEKRTEDALFAIKNTGVALPYSTMANNGAQAVAAARNEVLQTYYGGNEESFYGDAVKNQDKFKALIDQAMPKQIADNVLVAGGPAAKDTPDIVKDIVTSGHADGTGVQQQQTTQAVQQYIDQKAKQVARKTAYEYLVQRHPLDYAEGKDATNNLDIYIQRNLDAVTEQMYPSAREHVVNQFQKRSQALQAMTPQDASYKYATVKPGSTHEEKFGPTISDSNIISTANAEIYKNTTDNTMEDVIGQERGKNISPLFERTLEGSPFEQTPYVDDTYSMLAHLSDQALEVLASKYATTYELRKQTATEMEKSEDPNLKAAQANSLRTLLTINFINDLKYLRNRWYNNEGQEPELVGKTDIPAWWQSTKESIALDPWLFRILGIRRGTTANVQASVQSERITELQRLQFMKTMFEQAGDGEAIDFINRRIDFYNTAMKHVMTYTGAARYEYDNLPFAIQTLIELPYDTVQNIAAPLHAQAFGKALGKINTPIMGMTDQTQTLRAAKYLARLNNMKKNIADSSTIIGPYISAVKNMVGATIDTISPDFVNQYSRGVAKYALRESAPLVAVMKTFTVEQQAKYAEYIKGTNEIKPMEPIRAAIKVVRDTIEEQKKRHAATILEVDEPKLLQKDAAQSPELNNLVKVIKKAAQTKQKDELANTRQQLKDIIQVANTQLTDEQGRIQAFGKGIANLGADAVAGVLKAFDIKGNVIHAIDNWRVQEEWFGDSESNVLISINKILSRDSAGEKHGRKITEAMERTKTYRDKVTEILKSVGSETAENIDFAEIARLIGQMPTSATNAPYAIKAMHKLGKWTTRAHDLAAYAKAHDSMWYAFKREMETNTEYTNLVNKLRDAKTKAEKDIARKALREMMPQHQQRVSELIENTMGHTHASEGKKTMYNTLERKLTRITDEIKGHITRGKYTAEATKEKVVKGMFRQLKEVFSEIQFDKDAYHRIIAVAEPTPAQAQQAAQEVDIIQKTYEDIKALLINTDVDTTGVDELANILKYKLFHMIEETAVPAGTKTAATGSLIGIFQELDVLNNTRVKDIVYELEQHMMDNGIDTHNVNLDKLIRVMAGVDIDDKSDDAFTELLTRIRKEVDGRNQTWEQYAKDVYAGIIYTTNKKGNRDWRYLYKGWTKAANNAKHADGNIFEMLESLNEMAGNINKRSIDATPLWHMLDNYSSIINVFDEKPEQFIGSFERAVKELVERGKNHVNERTNHMIEEAIIHYVTGFKPYHTLVEAQVKEQILSYVKNKYKGTDEHLNVIAQIIEEQIKPTVDLMVIGNTQVSAEKIANAIEGEAKYFESIPTGYGAVLNNVNGINVRGAAQLQPRSKINRWKLIGGEYTVDTDTMYGEQTYTDIEPRLREQIRRITNTLADDANGTNNIDEAMQDAIHVVKVEDMTVASVVDSLEQKFPSDKYVSIQASTNVATSITHIFIKTRIKIKGMNDFVDMHDVLTKAYGKGYDDPAVIPMKVWRVWIAPQTRFTAKVDTRPRGIAAISKQLGTSPEVISLHDLQVKQQQLTIVKNKLAAKLTKAEMSTVKQRQAELQNEINEHMQSIKREYGIRSVTIEGKEIYVIGEKNKLTIYDTINEALEEAGIVAHAEQKKIPSTKIQIGQIKGSTEIDAVYKLVDVIDKRNEILNDIASRLQKEFEQLATPTTPGGKRAAMMDSLQERRRLLANGLNNANAKGRGIVGNVITDAYNRAVLEQAGGTTEGTTKTTMLKAMTEKNADGSFGHNAEGSNWRTIKTGNKPGDGVRVEYKTRVVDTNSETYHAHLRKRSDEFERRATQLKEEANAQPNKETKARLLVEAKQASEKAQQQLAYIGLEGADMNGAILHAEEASSSLGLLSGGIYFGDGLKIWGVLADEDGGGIFKGNSSSMHAHIKTGGVYSDYATRAAELDGSYHGTSEMAFYMPASNFRKIDNNIAMKAEEATRLKKNGYVDIWLTNESMSASQYQERPYLSTATGVSTKQTFNKMCPALASLNGANKRSRHVISHYLANMEDVDIWMLLCGVIGPDTIGNLNNVHDIENTRQLFKTLIAIMDQRNMLSEGTIEGMANAKPRMAYNILKAEATRNAGKRANDPQYWISFLQTTFGAQYNEIVRAVGAKDFMDNPYKTVDMLATMEVAASQYNKGSFGFANVDAGNVVKHLVNMYMYIPDEAGVSRKISPIWYLAENEIMLPESLKETYAKAVHSGDTNVINQLIEAHATPAYSSKSYSHLRIAGFWDSDTIGMNPWRVAMNEDDYDGDEINIVFGLMNQSTEYQQLAAEIASTHMYGSSHRMSYAEAADMINALSPTSEEDREMLNAIYVVSKDTDDIGAASRGMLEYAKRKNISEQEMRQHIRTWRDGAYGMMAKKLLNTTDEMKRAYTDKAASLKTRKTISLIEMVKAKLKNGTLIGENENNVHAAGTIIGVLDQLMKGDDAMADIVKSVLAQYGEDNPLKNTKITNSASEGGYGKNILEKLRSYLSGTTVGVIDAQHGDKIGFQQLYDTAGGAFLDQTQTTAAAVLEDLMQILIAIDKKNNNGLFAGIFYNTSVEKGAHIVSKHTNRATEFIAPIGKRIIENSDVELMRERQIMADKFKERLRKLNITRKIVVHHSDNIEETMNVSQKIGRIIGYAHDSFGYENRGSAQYKQRLTGQPALSSVVKEQRPDVLQKTAEGEAVIFSNAQRALNRTIPTNNADSPLRPFTTARGKQHTVTELKEIVTKGYKDSQGRKVEVPLEFIVSGQRGTDEKLIVGIRAYGYKWAEKEFTEAVEVLGTVANVLMSNPQEANAETAKYFGAIIADMLNALADYDNLIAKETQLINKHVSEAINTKIEWLMEHIIKPIGNINANHKGAQKERIRTILREYTEQLHVQAGERNTIPITKAFVAKYVDAITANMNEEARNAMAEGMEYVANIASPKDLYVIVEIAENINPYYAKGIHTGRSALEKLETLDPTLVTKDVDYIPLKPRAKSSIHQVSQPIAWTHIKSMGADAEMAAQNMPMQYSARPQFAAGAAGVEPATQQLMRRRQPMKALKTNKPLKELSTQIAETITETMRKARTSLSEDEETVRTLLQKTKAPGHIEPLSMIEDKMLQWIRRFKAYTLSFANAGFRFVTMNAIEVVSKATLYLIEEARQGRPTSASEFWTNMVQKGNANDIWLAALAYNPSLSRNGVNASDAVMYIDGLRGATISDKYGARGIFNDTDYNSSIFGNTLRWIDDSVGAYLEWVSDNVETPFRNGLFSDQFRKHIAFGRIQNNKKLFYNAAQKGGATVDGTFFDFANKLNGLSGLTQAAFPFGDFQTMNAEYWIKHMANNPYLYRYLTRWHMLNNQKEGRDPRTGKIQIPFTDMYINPLSCMSFSNVLGWFADKPYYQKKGEGDLQRQYDNIKDMPAEMQEAYAYRTKNPKELLDYIRFQRVKYVGKIVRQLDAWLGMSGVARGTANVLAGITLGGKVFEGREYRSLWGNMPDLVNALWMKDELVSPNAFFKLIDPKHAQYIKEQNKKAIEKLMKGMNMSQAQAAQYIANTDRLRMLMVFLTGLFPQSLPKEFVDLSNYMQQYIGKQSYVQDDTEAFANFVTQAYVPDIDAYSLYARTQSAMTTGQFEMMKIVPIKTDGRVQFIPIVAPANDNQKTALFQLTVAGNPLYREDSKRVIEFSDLEAEQYAAFGAIAGTLVKPEHKTKFYQSRGLYPAWYLAALNKYYRDHYYDKLKNAREFMRAEAMGNVYAILDEKYYDDMKEVDQYEAYAKNRHIGKTELSHVKDTYSKWVYRYALKKYLEQNWNTINWLNADTVDKNALEEYGMAGYEEVLAGMNTIKNHGPELMKLSTFTGGDDINGMAWSPEKVANINPEVRKTFEKTVPDFAKRVQQGAQDMEKALRVSNYPRPQKMAPPANAVPRELRTFSKSPSRRGFVNLSEASIQWLRNNGAWTAYERTARTGVPTYLAQEIQKRNKYGDRMYGG